MEAPYYVASLRGSGWFSKSSQFNTQLSEAKQFDYLDAIALCKRYKANGHVLVPVRKSDMERI